MDSIIYYAILLWFGGRFVARLFYVSFGRVFGFYSLAHYHKFLGIVGWRFFYRPIPYLRDWFLSRLYGRRATAKWCSILERMSLVWKSGKIYIGRLQIAGIPLNQGLGLTSEKHVSIIANSAAGKSNLLTTMIALHVGAKKRSGNAFVIDCDGKIFKTLQAFLRGRGKKVLAIDPLKQTGSTASWNPFQELDYIKETLGEEAAIDFAETLSQALICDLDDRNLWIYSESRSFIFSLILFVWRFEKPENRNLIRLRQLLVMGLPGITKKKTDPFLVLLGVMKQKKDFGGIIAAGANTIADAQGVDGRNLPRTSAIDQTRFLDLPYVQNIIKTSDFKCADLKNGNTSLFLVCPVTDLSSKMQGFVRMLSMLTMEVFQKVEALPNTEPTLFCLDEMPNIGRIPAFATAAPVFRKYNIRLVTVSQTISNLKATYPKEWSDFLANSGACIWMANQHQETLEYLSSLLGTATRKEKLKPNLFRRLRKIEKTQTQRVERPLMYPHQLALYLERNMIVTRAGRPIRLKKGDYFKELPVSYYEPDPHYREVFFRRNYRTFRLWLIRTLKPKAVTYLIYGKVKLISLYQRFKELKLHKPSSCRAKETSTK